MVCASKGVFHAAAISRRATPPAHPPRAATGLAADAVPLGALRPLQSLTATPPATPKGRWETGNPPSCGPSGPRRPEHPGPPWSPGHPSPNPEDQTQSMRRASPPHTHSPGPPREVSRTHTTPHPQPNRRSTHVHSSLSHSCQAAHPYPWPRPPHPFCRAGGRGPHRSSGAERTPGPRALCGTEQHATRRRATTTHDSRKPADARPACLRPFHTSAPGAAGARRPQGAPDPNQARPSPVAGCTGLLTPGMVSPPGLRPAAASSWPGVLVALPPS